MLSGEAGLLAMVRMATTEAAAVAGRPGHLERTGHEAQRNKHGQCTVCIRAADEARTREKQRALMPEYFPPSAEPAVSWTSRRERMAITHRRRTGHEPDWGRSQRCAICNRQRKAEWAARNPEKAAAAARERVARRNARLRGVHTPEDIAKQIRAQSGLCYWCGTSLKRGYEVDHLVPVARGGSNGPENIVIACRECNLAKGSKLPEEFRAQMP